MNREGKIEMPVVGDGSGLEPDARLYAEELQLAFRNHSLPLEGLRYDVTPTGMHYTLVHYDIPLADAQSWRLSVEGAVRNRLNLTLAELMARQVQALRVTLECAGDGRALLSPRPISQPWLTGAVGTAEWTGTPLWPLLQEGGLDESAVEVLFTGLDRGIEGGEEQDYQRSLPLAEVRDHDAILAWVMNGKPLEPQHGFPLRLVIPGWFGMAHVKWLRSIRVLTEPFGGYQHRVYRYGDSREEPAEPVTLMRVRSLMVPPGVPDFLTRTRLVEHGRVELSGRAWSGRSPVTSVEVSADGGRTWAQASLEPPAASHPHAWQAWRYAWDAPPGTYELVCRATDARCDVQPIEQAWTARGMGNNMAQRVRVQVR